MANARIPEFGDLVAAEAAQSLLKAAQGQIDEANLTWSILAMADALAKFPCVGSIAVNAGFGFKDRHSHKPDRIHLGPTLPEGKVSHGYPSYDQLDKSARQEIWDASTLRKMAKAEKVFLAWAGDRRFESFMEHVRGPHGKGRTWIGRGADPCIERHLCSAIGRGDLWAKMEAMRLNSVVKEPKMARPAPRM